jgi:S1-C subfamily serine protease
MSSFYPALFVTTAIVTAVVGLAAAPGAPVQTPEQQAGQSSVKLSSDGRHGSGVIIGKNLILTNEHVASGFGKEGFKVTLPNGSTGIGHVLANGVGIDLALVNAETGDLPVAQIECSMPPVGLSVFSFGYPLKLDRIVTWGRVSGAPISAAYEGNAEVVGEIPMDLAINPGNSGGGVWTARNGKSVLVGVSNAAVLAPIGGPFSPGSLSGLSLMIPAPTLCHFLGRR